MTGSDVFLDLYLSFSHPWMYWLFYLVVAWPLAWAGHYATARLFPDRVDRRWAWHRHAGLALVLWPFVKHAYGVWVDFAFVLDTSSVAGTTPAWAWWLTIERRWWQYVLVPMLGLFLALGTPARLVTSRDMADRLWSALHAVDLVPKRSWGRDVAMGFGLFVVVYFAYLSLSLLLSPLREYDTGEESAVFEALTPALAFALSLTAGVTEELIFRGILQNRLRLFMPTWGAITIQSLFFGLIHSGYGTVGHILMPAIFGAAMGLVVLRWGLIPAILIHSLIDLVLFLAITWNLGHGWTWIPIYAVFLAGVALPAAYFIAEWLNRRGSAPPPGPQSGVATLK